MDSSTEQAPNIMEMVITIRENTSMDYLKDLVNIYGRITAFTRAISNKD